MKEFTKEEVQRLLDADQTSLPIENGWNLRTKLRWGGVGQDNLSDLLALPKEYEDIDDLISQFLTTKDEWNRYFVDFIRDFGLGALIAAKNNQSDLVAENGGSVLFEGRDWDVVAIWEVYIDFSKKLISVTVRT